MYMMWETLYVHKINQVNCHFYDIELNILECAIGYHGDNCSLKCRPPTFGEGCQALCDCPKTDCHFVHGCSNQLKTSTDDHRYSIY